VRKPALKIYRIDFEQSDLSSGKSGQRGILSSDIDSWRAHGGGRILLLTGSADDLPFAEGEIDLVVMGTAIPLMPDKEGFLAEVARILRSGKTFVFNSVFFNGTFVPGAETLFTEWIKEAVLVLDEIDKDRARMGQPAAPRQRNTGGRAFSKSRMREAECHAVLERVGFINMRSGIGPMPR
jgi:ubiquinone/menaquinone biosynthesis C-methylase UbiE